jgi:hypothetical protein
MAAPLASEGSSCFSSLVEEQKKDANLKICSSKNREMHGQDLLHSLPTHDTKVSLAMEGVTLMESGTSRAHFAFVKRLEAAKTAKASTISGSTF